MQDSAVSTLLLPNDVEQELKAVRYHRKKAEIAFAAGIHFIRQHSVGGDFSDLQRAEHYFDAARRFAVSAGIPRIHLLSRVYLARIDVVESRHEAALTALESTEPEVNALNDTETRAAWCYTMALLLQYHGDPTQTIRYGKEALELYTALGFTRESMNCLFNLGVDYRKIGDYTTAFTYFSQALEMGLQHGSPFLEYYYTEIGSIYLRDNNYAAAMDCINKSADLFRQKQDFAGLIYCYSSVAMHYSKRENFQEALIWFRQCSTIAEDHNIENVYFKLNYADTLFRLTEYAQALALYENIVALSRIRNDVEYIMFLQRRIAGVYVALGQMELSKPLLADCLEYYAEAYENAEELCEVYKLLSCIAESDGDAVIALEYYKRYHTWKEKLYDQERQIDIRNAKYRLDVEIAAREREELKAKTVELERSLDAKRGELTALAMALSQKNQMMEKLQRRVKELTTAQQRDTHNNYRLVLHEIESLQQSGEEQWIHLQRQFESIDANFSMRLVQKHTTLTPIEIKICLLMKLSLSTKDIAHILWISPRTVETHRYQIRKKLKLHKDDTLFSVLAQI